MLLAQVTCNTPLTKVTKHKHITPSALFELLRVRSFFGTFFILADEVLP
jgi:Na+-translocating ferredoxin:NAD+ oxidoreductase RnfD subunit